MSRKEEIFYASIAMAGWDNPEDKLLLGDVEPVSVPGIFRQILDEYTANINHHIQKAVSNDVYTTLNAHRCDSYQDYINLLNERYTMTEQREFTSKEAREYEKTQAIQRNVNFTPDDKGYFNYIQKFFSKLPVVEFFTLPRNVYLLEKERKKHSLITGGSGSGKSVTIDYILYEYLNQNRNNCLIVIDPHGTLAKKIVKFKDIDKRNLIYFDPSLSDEIYPCINPFQIEDKSEKNIEKTTEFLIEAFQETINNAELSPQMATILQPCISTLLRKGNASFYDILTFMDDTRNQELVEYAKRTGNRRIQDFFEFTFYNKRYSTTKQSITTKFQSLVHSTIFYNITCNKSTIDLEKEMNKKNIIIFRLSKGELGAETAKTFGRFVISMLQAYAMKREGQPEHSITPVHLFIDEFPNFVTPSIEIILTEARKYQVYVTAAMQYLGQNMGDKFQTMLLANTNIKITGKNGHKTLSIIARETGAKVEEMANLKPGEFAIKCGSGKSFTVRIPKTTLNDRQAVSNAELVKRIKNSMYKYYEFPEEEENNSQHQEHGRQASNTRSTSRKAPLKPNSDF